MFYPNNSLLKWFALLLALALNSSAHAQLHWEKKTLEIGARPGQKEAIRDVLRTSYRFTNTGKKPVTITSIQPDCGCVTTELEKFDYAPGESGEIKITFDLEMDDSNGLLKRSIAVTTSDAPGSPTTLKLRINVPEILTVSTKHLVWARGEKPLAKETIVKAARGFSPMKLSEAFTNSDDFSVEILPEVAGKRYRVKVTPRSTAAGCYAQIHLQAEIPHLEPAIVKINSLVQ